MKNRRKILIFSVIIFLGLVMPKFYACAFEIIYPPVPGAETPQVFSHKIEQGEYEKNQEFPLYIKYVYHLLVLTTGIVCLVSIITGSLQYYVFSFGAPGKMKEGADKISVGVLGAVLVFSSFIILKTLDPNLLVFQIAKPELEKKELLTLHEEPTLKNTYVEIPFGSVLQEAKEWSEVVRRDAENVWELGSVKGRDGTATLTELSMCLAILIDNCNCATNADCLASEPPDHERCTKDCADTNNTGTCSPDDFCETSVDPCDIECPVGSPDCIPISYLCDEASYSELPTKPTHFTITNPENGETIEADLKEGSLNDLDTDNLRDAINNIESRLKFTNGELKKRIRNLLISREYLLRESASLKIAEGLMRTSMPSDFSNFDSFIGLKQSLEDQEEIVDIDRIWPHMVSPSHRNTEGGSVIEFESPAQECSGDKDYEIVPSCALCRDTLFCCGNSYRINNQDDCETEEIIRDLCDGDNVPRSCEDHWFAQDAFYGNGVVHTILYNGMEYPLPDGGVHICGSNVFGCVNEKCK